MIPVEHLVPSQCKLGEGPVWHPHEQALYWLDIYQSCLHRFDPASGGYTVTELGMLASALGVRAAGGFVMATQQGFALWDTHTQQFDLLGDLDPHPTVDIRFNDGKTDPQGRFWAGKMSQTFTNSLFRLDPDHSIQRMEVNICISNGLGWSPDGRTFYYTDSLARAIYAYDFDPASGDLANRRIFAQVPNGNADGNAGGPPEGLPDGLAVDSEGCLWSARWGGWKVVRYDPQGQIIQSVPMPVEFPTSCAFGGPDLSDLYVTSAWVEVKPEARDRQPQAGDLFRLRPGVRGLPEPLYLG